MRLQVKHSNAFYVRRVRKHVDDAGERAAVTACVDQHTRVARQGGGVAADVNNAFRALPIVGLLRVQIRQGFDERKGAFAGRVDQPFVGHAVFGEQFGRHFE